jgi:hypothetical protein
LRGWPCGPPSCCCLCEGGVGVWSPGGLQLPGATSCRSRSCLGQAVVRGRTSRPDVRRERRRHGLVGTQPPSDQQRAQPGRDVELVLVLGRWLGSAASSAAAAPASSGPWLRDPGGSLVPWRLPASARVGSAGQRVGSASGRSGVRLAGGRGAHLASAHLDPRVVGSWFAQHARAGRVGRRHPKDHLGVESLGRHPGGTRTDARAAAGCLAQQLQRPGAGDGLGAVGRP